MKNIKGLLPRKIIPLIAITGAMGGTVCCLMEVAGSEWSFYLHGLLVLGFAAAGTAVGLFALLFFNNRGQSIVARNERGNILLTRQPAYLSGALAVIAAFVIFMKAGLGAAIIAAIAYGLTFILGVANGIFDYRESATKNILMLAILPIGFSFIYAYYIRHSDAAIDMAWVYGSIYLFSYLLFLNRMKLNSIIFFRKSVNIEDSRKIRIFNDWLIILLYGVYLVMFNFRGLISVTYSAFQKVLAWILKIMEAIINFLIAEIPDTGNRVDLTEKEKVDELPAVERPWLVTLLRIIMFTIIGAVAIAAVISLVILVIKIIKRITESFRINFNKAAGEKKIEAREYEEENEIVKDEDRGSFFSGRKKKMQYSLKKLRDIPLAVDKVRYVYGFVLERLYHRHINIEESDTPEEIIDKIGRHRNGEKLNKMGFEEFTQKYREARYSSHDIEDDPSLEDKAAEFEKGVGGIYVEPKKD